MTASISILNMPKFLTATISCGYISFSLLALDFICFFGDGLTLLVLFYFLLALFIGDFPFAGDSDLSSFLIGDWDLSNFLPLIGESEHGFVLADFTGDSLFLWVFWNWDFGETLFIVGGSALIFIFYGLSLKEERTSTTMFKLACISYISLLPRVFI